MTNEMRAFPIIGKYQDQFTGNTEYHAQFGLTARDYFAASVAEWCLNEAYKNADPDDNQGFIRYMAASLAYEMADAMMNARKPAEQQEEVLP